MIKPIMGVVVLAVLLAACAPIVKEVKIAYSPTIGEPARTETKSPKKIRIEPFTDKRAGDALGEVTGQYGSMGKYVAGNDVTKIITDAVKMELANQGYQTTEGKNEDIALSGSLLALTGNMRQWIGGMVEGRAQLSVVLRDTRQGKIVWSDIVNGKSEVTFGVFTMNVHSKFEEAINLAIKDLVNTLIKSESFHEALE